MSGQIGAKIGLKGLIREEFAHLGQIYDRKIVFFIIRCRSSPTKIQTDEID